MPLMPRSRSALQSYNRHIPIRHVKKQYFSKNSFFRLFVYLSMRV